MHSRKASNFVELNVDQFTWGFKLPAVPECLHMLQMWLQNVLVRLI